MAAPGDARGLRGRAGGARPGAAGRPRSAGVAVRRLPVGRPRRVASAGHRRRRRPVPGAGPRAAARRARRARDGSRTARRRRRRRARRAGRRRRAPAAAGVRNRTARRPGGAWLAALVPPATGRSTGVPAPSRPCLAELARWQADAVGGPVRACFRLVEPPEGAARRALAARVRAAGRRRAEPRRDAGPVWRRPAAGAVPARRPRRRRPCSPSSAGPAACTRRWRTPCARPGRPRSPWTPPARTRFLTRARAAAGRRRLRDAAARLVAQAAGPARRPAARARLGDPARHRRRRQRRSASAPSSTTAGSSRSATSP